MQLLNIMLQQNYLADSWDFLGPPNLHTQETESRKVYQQNVRVTQQAISLLWVIASLEILTKLGIRFVQDFTARLYRREKLSKKRLRILRLQT